MSILERKLWFYSPTLCPRLATPLFIKWGCSLHCTTWCAFPLLKCSEANSLCLPARSITVLHSFLSVEQSSLTDAEIEKRESTRECCKSIVEQSPNSPQKRYSINHCFLFSVSFFKAFLLCVYTPYLCPARIAFSSSCWGKAQSCWGETERSSWIWTMQVTRTPQTATGVCRMGASSLQDTWALLYFLPPLCCLFRSSQMNTKKPVLAHTAAVSLLLCSSLHTSLTSLRCCSGLHWTVVRAAVHHRGKQTCLVVKHDFMARYD